MRQVPGHILSLGFVPQKAIDIELSLRLTSVFTTLAFL
jgi:hypothetical protein